MQAQFPGEICSSGLASWFIKISKVFMTTLVKSSPMPRVRGEGGGKVVHMELHRNCLLMLMKGQPSACILLPASVSIVASWRPLTGQLTVPLPVPQGGAKGGCTSFTRLQSESSLGKCSTGSGFSIVLYAQRCSIMLPVSPVRGHAPYFTPPPPAVIEVD